MSLEHRPPFRTTCAIGTHCHRAFAGPKREFKGFLSLKITVTMCHQAFGGTLVIHFSCDKFFTNFVSKHISTYPHENLVLCNIFFNPFFAYQVHNFTFSNLTFHHKGPPRPPSPTPQSQPPTPPLSQRSPQPPPPPPPP